MANIQRKTIQVWDGGIKTSSRESLQNTSDGAQMIKGFDVYKDPKKMIPMQSWESFTTDAEKGYGIRAMGGISDTVYGAGNALTNWYGSAWNYRLKVNVRTGLWGSSLPMRLDMSLLPADFWTHVNADMSDVRVTKSNHEVSACHVENLDYANQTGDLWVQGSAVDGSATILQSVTTSNASLLIQNVDNGKYGFNFPISLTGETFNTLTIKLHRIGIPTGDLNILLYNNNAGVPGTLVATLGTINKDFVTDSNTNQGHEYTIGFDDQTLTGTYHIVFSDTSGDASNFYRIAYQDAGSSSIYYASNAGLTAWTIEDSSATPYFKLQYATPDYFYLYYGNSTASQIPYGTPSFDYTDGGRGVFSASSIRYAYTFGDEEAGNKYYSEGDTGTTEAFTTDPQTYADGYFGKSIQTFGGTIQTNDDDDVGVSSNDISISFMVYPTVWTSTVLVADGNGYFNITLDTNGKINFTVNGSDATGTSTSTLPVPLNRWSVVDCVFDGDHHITINGFTEDIGMADGNYDGGGANDFVIVKTNNQTKLAQVWGIDNDLTDADVYAKFNNFTNDTFFDVGTEEDLSSLNKQYDGFQLYYKNISSGDWTEYLESGRPVKSLGVYPTNSWIDDSGSYFIISDSPENAGFLFVAERTFLTVLNASFLLLGVLAPNSRRIVLQSEVAQGDTTLYYNWGSSAIGDLGTASEQTFMSTVASLASWRTYLAAASTYRNRANIEIWDLSNASNAITERVDIGTGNARIVGNASDILFAVVDNFVDDAVKSAGKPTVEIRQYTGNGQSKKTHVLEIPVNIDDSTYTDNWELAVSSFKIRRNTQTLFYARLPKDSSGLTFNEGFWAVGKNSREELSLTLQIDTEGLGMPENVFAFAQQVFFIAKDGGIYRLSDNTYNNVALFTSLKFNEGNTEIEKKLIGVEIITEPLESGQTISVYYKKNGDTTRTKIFDMTGEGEISYETTYDINEANLPHYKEIEFDVESTGGKSAPLELAYKYEYLSNIV